MIYELLVGTKLFASEFQLSGYFYGKRPFPEDKLKELSPPTDNLGISLLESMLLIQPEDRPTAAGALSHGWLTALKTGDGDSREDQGGAGRSQGASTLSRKRKIGLATHDGRKKRRTGKSPITQDDARCTPVDVDLEVHAGSHSGCAPTTPKAITDTCGTTPSGASSVLSSVVQARPQKSELMPHNFQSTHSEGLKTPRKKGISNVLRTRSQSSTPNTPSPTFL